jgi:hypothetical protein
MEGQHDEGEQHKYGKKRPHDVFLILTLQPQYKRVALNVVSGISHKT